ncbi:hypothetical protein QWY90_03020 [Flavobacterium paronense]|uniref:Uncharacterized protein n=1 Tax=Flavobacterium paronense TaxID=1392775 RepID=A0ABV5GCP5_9FLAO|nr:hypothetical protein [Flavobacterium paronense]MDN3676278.1 hypothetical protein [Flavobacterium paronense]
MNRICIYAKDIQQITGKSERQAREIIKKIRANSAKPKHQPITVDDFCDYFGFDPPAIIPLLK